jgi:Protein of unknown function (DUF3048) N-terminal domain/Protein of unknown function (DUF3048) C-terminal domain
MAEKKLGLSRTKNNNAHNLNSYEHFRTPEEMAAQDDRAAASAIVASSGALHIKDKDVSKRKLRLEWPPTKKQIIIIIIVVIVLAGLGFLGYQHFHKAKPVKVTATLAVIIKPTTVPSNLTGLPVNPSLNNLPVTAVMVENSTDARPQSGLSQAGVVFEAVAEGGVTRFMALYQDTSPSSVGPIRSARPYYVQWALGFDAAYAHVGGSPDALSDITAWGVKDMNQFSNGGSFQRVSSRPAPHNVYTSIATLNQLESSKGYGASHFTSWTRKVGVAAKVPTAATINLSLSGPVYNPTYSFQAATDSYNRSEGGTPQTDAGNNTQVSPKVVIAIVVPETSGALDASGAYYSDYNVIGSGTAYIFQNGTVTTGQWSKSSNDSQILFTDSAGKPAPLDPGQVWISAVTSTSAITYTK